MSGTRATVIAYGTSAVLGLLLWTLTAHGSHRTEPWDAPGYWTISYPIAIGLSGVLGLTFPQRPWRWAAVLMFSQLVVMLLGGSDASLLPLGLILMAALTLPAAALATLCAWARG